MSDIFSIANRVILVTGSTRGLGWHTAQMLAEAGARLVIHGRTSEACEARQKELQQRGHSVDAVHFSMEDHEAVGKSIDAIVDRHGGIWGVVNNAGMGMHSSLEDETVGTYEKMLSVHAIAPFQLIQAAARHMKRADGPDRGRIVNVSSIAFTSPRAGICNYTTAKAAVVGLTRAVAAELGADGICCNVVAPGYFRTENTEFLHSNDAFRDKIKSRTPAHRWGDPRELAGAIQFLLSPASSYVNGQYIGVDGGMSHFLHDIEKINQS